MSVNL